MNKSAAEQPLYRMPATPVRLFAKALAALGGACLVLMMLQMALDVALKYLLNSPIEGNLEIVSTYYMVGVVFLPLALVEINHQHISVDLGLRALPRRLRTCIYVFNCLVCAVFFAILGYQTLLDAIEATRAGEIMMGSISVTIWPARWVLPVGFLAVMLAALLNALTAILTADQFDPLKLNQDKSDR